jgi:hypothetical protein
LETVVRSLPRSLALIAALALTAGLAACGDDDDASASFTSPSDDAHIAGGVELELAADGITIEEAGEVRDGAGHFHVVADEGCVETGEAIAKDADHVHLGKGQSAGTIYLEPGTHELCVQVGDGEHHALDVTDTITVSVGIEDLDQWCAVVEEVDDKFDETDNSDDEVDVKQASYANILRLTAQLQAGMDVVDADQRATVAEAIDAAATFAEVLSTVTDQAEIEERLAPLYENDPFAEAGVWIEDTCGVSITS